MLTDSEMTVAEGIFLCIDQKQISDETAHILISNVYHMKQELFIYLIWLIDRWPYLRHNVNDLPKRINHSNLLDNVIHRYRAYIF